jgi:hypothetical protein
MQTVTTMPEKLGAAAIKRQFAGTADNRPELGS